MYESLICRTAPAPSQAYPMLPAGTGGSPAISTKPRAAQLVTIALQTGRNAVARWPATSAWPHEYRAESRLSPRANQHTGQLTTWVGHPALVNGRQRVHIEPWPPSRRLPKTSSAAATHAVSTVLTSWGGRGSLLACLEPAPPADPTKSGLAPPAGRRGRGGRNEPLLHTRRWHALRA